MWFLSCNMLLTLFHYNKLWIPPVLALTSSLETLSENSLPISKDPESQESFHFNSEVELNNLDTTYSVSEFYKPDIRIHSRFIDELDEEDEESIDEEMIQDDTSSGISILWTFVLKNLVLFDLRFGIRMGDRERKTFGEIRGQTEIYSYHK